MSQYQVGSDARAVSGWVIGGITLAGVVLILVGSFQALTGLAAIFNDDFFVVARNYAFDLDVTAWGWIHLLIGVFLFVAGFALFAGKVWAAVTGVLLAMISAVSNFFFIPYYPWWSLLVIALDIWVIWALTRPGAVQTQGV
jgi:hypothetical protein